MKTKHLIYKATNITNGKSYIGFTKSTLEQRKQSHRAEARKKLNNYPFYNAIRKYGWDAFEWEIVEELTCLREEAAEREKYWIAHYDTYNSGYNATNGGDKNKEVSEESRAKMRKPKRMTVERLLNQMLKNLRKQKDTPVDVLARREAQRNSELTYIGKPCEHGHTIRNTKRNYCVECDRQANKNKYKANTERYSKGNKEWRRMNPLTEEQKRRHADRQRERYWKDKGSISH